MMIKSKYGNTKAFSEHINVPYTTVRTILKNGVGKAGVDNVFKICKGLDISPDSLTNEFSINEVVANTMGVLISLENERQNNVYRCAQTQLSEQNNVIEFPDRAKELIRGRRMAGGSALHVIRASGPRHSACG